MRTITKHFSSFDVEEIKEIVRNNEQKLETENDLDSFSEELLLNFVVP